VPVGELWNTHGALAASKEKKLWQRRTTHIDKILPGQENSPVDWDQRGNKKGLSKKLITHLT